MATLFLLNHLIKLFWELGKIIPAKPFKCSSVRKENGSPESFSWEDFRIIHNSWRVVKALVCKGFTHKCSGKRTTITLPSQTDIWYTINITPLVTAVQGFLFSDTGNSNLSAQKSAKQLIIKYQNTLDAHDDSLALTLRIIKTIKYAV